MIPTPSGTKVKVELLCRNAQGDIVLVSKVWKGLTKTHAAVSLYGVRGITIKSTRLLHRKSFKKSLFAMEDLETARDAVAHLWAMQAGISDYVVIYDYPLMRDMFHPSELNQQENQ
jgi:hypothetical protein